MNESIRVRFRILDASFIKQFLIDLMVLYVCHETCGLWVRFRCLEKGSEFVRLENDFAYMFLLTTWSDNRAKARKEK